MKITVITVCLNAEKTIKDTISSIIEQDYEDIEYIVVDGKSTDGTLSVFEKYKKNINVLISEKDSGIYDAMNKGVKLATGEFVYFLNSDDRFYDKSVLSDIAKIASTNPNTDYFYGGVVCKNLFGGKSMNIFLKKISRFSFKCGQNIKHQSIFVRRKLFNNFGQFNTEYKVSADYEWQCRLIAAGCHGLFVNRLIAYYNQEGYSSKGTWFQYKEKIGIINKHFGFFFSTYFLIESIFKFSITKILRKLRIAPFISKIINKLRNTSIKEY